MPLSCGFSPPAFSRNVAAEMEAGKPQAQAVAIAYREARGATLKRVAADARKHHGLRLTGKIEGWPAKLDAAGAAELAEQVRNVLAHGPVGKKRKSVNYRTMRAEELAARANNGDEDAAREFDRRQTPRSSRKASNKEEREAKRRGERRAAEDSADSERRSLAHCEGEIAEHEKIIKNSKAEIERYRKKCRGHKVEIKKLEAKIRRLS